MPGETTAVAPEVTPGVEPEETTGVVPNGMTPEPEATVPTTVGPEEKTAVAPDWSRRRAGTRWLIFHLGGGSFNRLMYIAF